MLALGTIWLFVMAMLDPDGFAAGMAGLALVPEPLWWLLGAVVALPLEGEGDDFVSLPLAFGPESPASGGADEAWDFTEEAGAQREVNSEAKSVEGKDVGRGGDADDVDGRELRCGRDPRCRCKLDRG
jgi:hypothetical protein